MTNPTRDSKTPAQLVTLQERRATAVQLARDGLNYVEIGEQLGITKQSAHALVRNTLERYVQTPTEELRSQEAALCDRMIATFLPLAEDPTADSVSRNRAAMTVWRYINTRARLLGEFIQPEVVEVTESREERAERLVGRVREWKAGALDAAAHELPPVNGNGKHEA